MSGAIATVGETAGVRSLFLLAVSSAYATILPMGQLARTAQQRPLGELTREVLGEPLSMQELWEMLTEADPRSRGQHRTRAHETVWIGSVGYERHKDSQLFARTLAEAGVERLIDVRELPISRRRGYAKTALSAAMASEGVEYLHLRSLGNPKHIRDLYKSGRSQEGRRLYERFLLGERSSALADLVSLLRSKRTALMCLEDDPAACHRSVIIDALRDHLELELEVANIA